ncbi:MAG: hypothetical protein R3A48_24115 [Polyangiales bacterium]
MTAAAPVRPGCLVSLRDALPERTTQWWIVRPRRIFSHPRLGASLIHSVDHLAERALVERAGRVGYDVRAVERGLYAITPGGELAVGLGAFDAARIIELLWERLLPPRRRVEGRRGVTRVEGRLGRAEVTAAVDASCGVAAWSEGDARLVDRALAGSHHRVEGDDDTPDELVRGQITRDDRHASEALGPLTTRTRRVEVVASLVDDGVALRITLRGELSSADEGALRARVRLATQSPLLRAIGATTWAADHRVEVHARDQALDLSLQVPWAGFEALSELLRGRAPASSGQDAQGF